MERGHPVGSRQAFFNRIRSQLHYCQSSCHEDCPGCLQEKVVLHVSHPDQRLLHPGDFYLLVPPASFGTSSSPCLLVCSVSAHGPYVEQQEVSGVALYSLFTVAWLDTLNKEREQRGVHRLEKCVISTRRDIVRILWEDLVLLQEVQSCDPTRVSLQIIPSSQTDQSASSSEGEESEGEYVELMEDVEFPRLGPQRGSLTQNGLIPDSSYAAAPGGVETLLQDAEGTRKHNLSSEADPSTQLMEEEELKIREDEVSVGRDLEKKAEEEDVQEDNVEDVEETERDRIDDGVQERKEETAEEMCARDRQGRALLTVQCAHSVWSHPDCQSVQILRLLEYCTATLRKDVLAAGLMVLVDGRQATPLPAVFSALHSLQKCVSGSLHTVLLLNHGSLLHLDQSAAREVEVLHSLRSVYKLVERQQLPAEFGGSLKFSQRSWIIFRMRVDHLTVQCEDVIRLLLETIRVLETTPSPPAAEEAEQLLSLYNKLMCDVLQDSRLVALQQDGGALLSQLRREEVCEAEDCRATADYTSSLYERVDELLHRLVTLSNCKTQQIKFILEFWSLQPGFLKVKSWLSEVGEVRLRGLEEPEDSLDQMIKKHQDFKEFCTSVHDQCKQGQELLRRLQRFSDVSSSDLQLYEVKVHSFWSQLQMFCQRLNTAGRTIERTLGLYRFFDQAYGWSLEGMRHLATISMEECSLPDKCQAVIDGLEEYRRQHPPILDSRFQEMKVAAEELRGVRGLSQWSFAWSKCQETKKMFDRKMEAAMRTRASNQRRLSDSTQRLTSDSASSLSPDLARRLSSDSSPRTSSQSSPEVPTNSNPRPPPESPQIHASASRKMFSGLRGVLERIPSLPEHDAPVSSQHTPLLRRLFRTSSEEASICSSTLSLNSSSTSSSCSLQSSRRQHLRKTQSFDCPPTPDPARYHPCPRALSEPARRGNTGVFIKGLEVSSTEAADRTLCPRSGAHRWAAQGPHSPGTPGTPRTAGPTSADLRPRGSKLRHIVDEMVTTEREYVRSLRYIVENYFPEVDRDDVPQDLRGKRSVVFGNLEKLLDFHNQFFLKELEVCQKHPLRVSHCFLRHSEQFALYALYSKNKPKSDALLAGHGPFFKRKQQELADKMDLSSYLLKPIQRMSKYALLLADIIKEVGDSQEAELPSLQGASNMVKFQLRHGNDLLAMDAIRNCDVNLKEQGQLLRQDEFTVWTGRKKSQRHVFLFEELLLFSKPKKMEGGLDVFHYKHSFKTADLGLTESTGKDGLGFEIWFRKRTVKNQTLVLQARSSEIKHNWTNEIGCILWTQATRNKEMRLKEMVSMGVGNKPFLDIKPSDAAISDRAVHCIMGSRGARTRASIAVSAFDHAHPFKHSPVTPDPQVHRPSSASLLGPLNLHLYRYRSPRRPTNAILLPELVSLGSQSLPSSPGSFVNEADEHETSSQPSITTESSGSSSHCLSGSTGSDSGCVSSHLQEPAPEETPGSSPVSPNTHLSHQINSKKPVQIFSPTTFV
ncbi:puratrophin-1 [Neosynchiropus ocellatus]